MQKGNAQMTHYVRPFGFLGARYSVSSRGLLYHRLSWASVAIGVVLGGSVMATTRESASQGWIGIAILVVTVFIVVRFTALVVENGQPAD